MKTEEQIKNQLERCRDDRNNAENSGNWKADDEVNKIHNVCIEMLCWVLKDEKEN